MLRFIFTAIVLVSILSACSSTEDGKVPPPRATPKALAPSPGDEPAPVDPDATFTADPAPPATGWSERFNRRFAESYLAETEIEPTLDAEEYQKLLAIRDLLSADDLDGAEALARTHAADDANEVFDFMLANILLQKDQFAAAAGSYEKAVLKFPKFRRAWRQLGVTYVRLGEFQKALPALTKVIQLGGSDAVTYGLLGHAYSNAENPLSAESSYRMANLLDPDAKDWKFGLAHSFYKQGRFPDAISLFGNLIKAEPDRAELWLAQGEAYARVKQPLKAAENFEMVDRLGGSTVASLNNLADIYANHELHDLAVKSYLRAMEKDPEHRADRALRAAKYLGANGVLDETRTLCDGIEKIRGDGLLEEEKKVILRLRARMALAQGADDEEARVLEQIVALDPRDGEALILLGQHRRRASKPEEAIFYYERAAQLEKFEADAKVRHAQLLVSQGKYQEALPLLRRAQAVNHRENIQEYLERVERVAAKR